jgi:penicillin amidase
MRKLLRGIARLFSALGIIVLLLAASLCGALWLTLPGRNEQTRIPGLSAPVDVNFDSDGIPRIHAATELDAAVALGYVHARDRMFQMELMRRNASGRLSELAGAVTLPLDRMMRTLGLRHSAEADYAALPPASRALLEAYASGVNARIAQRGRFIAPEFLVLGAPEPWTPVDTLLWAKTMGLWLSLNWRTELSRQALAGHVPQRLIDELWPDLGGPGRPQAMLQPGAPGTGLIQEAAAAERLAAVLPQFPSPFTLPGTASNEWAVDGRHTATGAPLLAGDPHLAFGFPGIWYLARIEVPGLTLVGATAPGVPGLVLGHNGHIAWTFTTTGADTQDIFQETPVGTDQYATPDGPQPFVTREERIKVRGQPDEVLTVRATRHGPVISDLQGRSGPILAVQMANTAPGDTAAEGLFALDHATSVAEAGKAAAQITSPVQNLLVADRAGIGLFVTGRIPIRRAGDGAAPVPGDGSHDWTGWAAGEALPHYVNPPSGRLVNANERIAPPDFPVFLGRDWFGAWRADRIREMLDGSDRHTAADFAHMQTDAVSLFARKLLPVLLAVPPPAGATGQAQALLRGWDGAMAIDAPQPLIFNAWVDAFYARVLQRAGIALSNGGPIPDFVAWLLTSRPTGGPVAGPAAHAGPGSAGAEDGPAADWCGGDCTADLAAALQDAVAKLTDRFGADPAAWRWGTAHPAVFAHPILRNIPVLRGLTTLSIPSPGDDTTVDRGGPRFDDFTSVHGASYRAVYDLADLDRSLFMAAPGQSGNPFSALRGNFLQRWRDGVTITIGPKPDSIAATIRLDP